MTGGIFRFLIILECTQSPFSLIAGLTLCLIAGIDPRSHKARDYARDEAKGGGFVVKG